MQKYKEASRKEGHRRSTIHTCNDLSGFQKPAEGKVCNMHCLSDIYPSISIYGQHKNSLCSIITIWLKTYRHHIYWISESETLPSRLFLSKMSYTTTLLPRSGWWPWTSPFWPDAQSPCLSLSHYKHALKLPPRRPLSHMPKPTFSVRLIIPDLIHLPSFLTFSMKQEIWPMNLRSSTAYIVTNFCSQKQL